MKDVKIKPEWMMHLEIASEISNKTLLIIAIIGFCIVVWLI